MRSVDAALILLMMGIASYYTTTAIRLLPPFSAWTRAGIKPLACDLCMSFWTSMIWSTGFHLAGFDSSLVRLEDVSKAWSHCIGWALWTAAMGGISYILLRKAGEPPPLPDFVGDPEFRGIEE